MQCYALAAIGEANLAVGCLHDFDVSYRCNWVRVAQEALLARAVVYHEKTQQAVTLFDRVKISKCMI